MELTHQPPFYFLLPSAPSLSTTSASPSSLLHRRSEGAVQWLAQLTGRGEGATHEGRAAAGARQCAGRRGEEAVALFSAAAGGGDGRIEAVGARLCAARTEQCSLEFAWNSGHTCLPDAGTHVFPLPPFWRERKQTPVQTA